jgi:hypothetical protein
MVKGKYRPLFPGRDNRFPLYKSVVWPEAQSRKLLKISPPPGFDRQSDQPVDSRYTDWTIPSTLSQPLISGSVPR